MPDTSHPIRLLRLLAGGLAVALSVWALEAPAFRDAEGALRGSVCLPLAVALAIAVAALAIGSRLQAAALWLGLVIVGQASSLQLIQAGNRVGYQHYRPLSSLTGTTATVSFGLVVLQAAVVFSGMRRPWPRFRAWLDGRFRPWQWGVLLGILFLASATLSRDPRQLAAELVLATAIELVSLANLVLVALAIPSLDVVRLKAVLDRLVERPGEPGKAMRFDRVLLACAAWVTTLAAVLSLVSYQRHPHVPDEVSYLLQARYFAAGKLAMPAPPVPAAFNVDIMTYEPVRWFSPFPPGWPAVLALGVRAGIPWLVNPILGGVNVLLAAWFLGQIYSPRTARLAVLLFCLSPWNVFLAMSFMSHTASLTAALLAAGSVARLRSTGRPGWAWLGGFGLAAVSLVRPLEGIAIGTALVGWTVTGRDRRNGPGATAHLIVAASLFGAITLPYNRLLTGSPTRFPVMDYFDRYYGKGVNDLGFGANRGVGWGGLDPFPGHDLKDAAINADFNTFAIGVELFGWGTGSLVLLALALVLGVLERGDRLMVVAMATIVFVHAFYWFSGGPDFGARYWFLVIVPCVALSARGIEVLEQHLSPEDAPRALAAVAAACATALLAFFPWRAVDKYHNYRTMRAGLREILAAHEPGRSLVLIEGRKFPDFASAAVYNPVDLEADVPVLAWDASPVVRSELLSAFPDRPLWVIAGPSVSGRGFELVAGPIEVAGADRAARVEAAIAGFTRARGRLTEDAAR